MKLYYRSGLLWNQIYFLIVSIVYLFTISSVGVSQSVFQFTNLESFLVSHKAIVIFALIAAITIYFSKKVSKALFLSFGLTCLLYSIYMMILHFSKISVVLVSGYIVLFYYFYQILSNELSLAFRNSLYSQNEIFAPLLKKIKVKLTDGNGQAHEAYLVNWDERSCYLKLITELEFNPQKHFEITANLEDYKLKDTGYLATFDKENSEVGIYFEEENSTYGWRHFSDIMEMLGLKVEYLK
jgi:hypothetical protein